MKVYTKTGDAGYSRLSADLRLSKGDIRFDALGALDELNSLLGWCRCEPGCLQPLQQDLSWIQDRIMTLAAQFAALVANQPASPSLHAICSADVARLEAAIDKVYEQMPMPMSFIVPAGCELTCRLHLARTCCRRAERFTTRCLEDRPQVAPVLRMFLNRLSDTLFVWALCANHAAGVANEPWTPHESTAQPTAK